MSFDPSQPWELVSGPDEGNTATMEPPPAASGFDPSQPFEIIEDATLPGPVPSRVPEKKEPPTFTGKDQPVRMVDGKLAFDPERFSEGVAFAWEFGLIDGDQYGQLKPAADKFAAIREQRRALADRAGVASEGKSFVRGVGRGSAMTLGALGGGKLLGLAAPAFGPAAPIAAPVLGGVGAVVGAVGAGKAYDDATAALAANDAEFDAYIAAEQLNPNWSKAGELTSLAIPAAGGVRALAVGRANVLKDRGAAAARQFVAKTTLAGAAFGAASDPLSRALTEATTPEQSPAEVLVEGKRPQLPIFDAGGMLTSAAAGALTAGLAVGNRRYSKNEVAQVLLKPTKQRTRTEQEIATRYEQMLARLDQEFPEGHRGEVIDATQTTFMGNPEATTFRAFVEPRLTNAPGVLPPSSRGPSPAAPVTPDAPPAASPPPNKPPPTAPEAPAAAEPPTFDPRNRAPLTFQPFAAALPATPATQARLASSFDPSQPFEIIEAAPVAAPPAAVDPVVIPPASGLQPAQFQTIEIPVGNISLSADVPNFKRNAGGDGVVDGERLEGSYDRLGTGPIIVWERTNGGLEVISGRHRLDLAKRSGEKTIPSQIVREADGFTTQDALTLDAELNIRDGQGTIQDYANYFRNSSITSQEAGQGGLLSRAKGRAGFSIGKGAGDDLYAAYQAGRISEAKTVAIAQTAPGNDAIQRAGLKHAAKLKADELPGFLGYLLQQAGPRAEQVDLFGADESAIAASVQLARDAASKAREIGQQIAAVQGAAKRPEQAAKLGVDVRDPEGLTRRIGELQALQTRYQNFHRDPEILASLRTGAPLPTVQAEPPRPAVPTINTQGEGNLFAESEMPFNLSGETDITPELERIAAAKQAAADKAEALDRDQVQMFAGSMPATAPSQGAGTTAFDPANPDAAYMPNKPANWEEQVQMFAGSMPSTGGSSPGPSPRPVPPTPPAPIAWLSQPGETPKGRAVIDKIVNPNRRAGISEIVNLVNNVVGVEMRRSTSQTTKRHPAHYRLRGHLAFTRRGQSQINFHEAGHGLKELIESRMPGELDKYKADWLALTKLPGSMASAENVHEGVAEWLRLRVMQPDAVESLRVTPIIETLTEQYYPGVMAGLRDAARAMNRFQALPVEQRWAAFTRANQDRPTLATILHAFVTLGESAANAIASGAPVSRADRAIYRAIVKNQREIQVNNRAAHALARATRSQTTEILDAYNMILQIGAETQKAISGTGDGRGIRVLGADNNFKMIFPQTWRDIVQRVPSKQWLQFQEAGWALESLNRYTNDKLEYPGMREGITPADLAAIVKKAQTEIPDFQAYFVAVQAFFDAILDVKELGGLKKPGEVDKMRKRGLYWPMPRVMQSLGGGRGPLGADISAGDYRARGSDDPIQDLTTVAEARTRDALTSYYWNRFGHTMVRNLGRIADDKRLPMEARAIAGQTITRMKMPTKIAASVSREEVQQMVYDAVLQQRAADLGMSPDDLAMTFKPDDINLVWDFKDLYRPTRPTDANVISLLNAGEREFYQLGDAAMFSMFSRPENVSKIMQAVSWALGPSMQNWKRNITQSLSFALTGNLPSDIITQMLLNRDAVGWVPGGALMLGIWNKFTRKYPQVFQEGLLLSRVEPSSVELINHVKHNAVWQWMTEGFYVSAHKDPTARLLLTLLQPSNLLFPAWKLGDLINLVTGGRTIAPLFESATREGAAVYTKMRGGSDQAAMDAYWRVSGRFNEHAGTAAARAAFSLPGFFNPMLQSVRNAGQVLFDPDPRVSGSAWAKLLILVPGMFGAAAVLRYLTMSDDDREREKERPLNDRLNFYDMAGLRLRFPYGPEGAMASFVFNSVMDELLERPKGDGRKTAIMLLKRIGDAGTPLQFLGPQLNTMSEAQMNWSNFQQRHIVSPWLVGLPASEQYASTTPEFYRKAGLWINYSPDKLQYIMRGAVSRQADEMIQLLDRIETNRPIQELADVPFVGRLFIRDPIGFGSDSLQRYGDVDERMQLLNRRLGASGYRWIKDAPADALVAQPDLLALRVQIDALEYLKMGASQLDKYAEEAKYYRLGQDWANERNVRVMMSRFAQSVLVGNNDEVERIQQAIDLLNQIEPASPAEQQEDYWQNR